LETSCLCDAKKTLRTLNGDIRPLVAGAKMVGRAFPIPCCDDFLPVLKALGDAAPGDVLMVDGQGGRKALAGELFTAEARRRGLAGIVVDGAVRDVAAIRTLGFPVYARLVSPVAGTTNSLASAMAPIACGGVQIHFGDYVDRRRRRRGGVVGGGTARHLPIAEEIQRTEAEVMRRIAAGESLLALLNLSEHLQAIGAGRRSQLRFIG
jgi:regulator of RNase E activity RraA